MGYGGPGLTAAQGLQLTAIVNSLVAAGPSNTGTSEQTSGINSIFSAYTQMFAAAAKAIIWANFVVSIREASGGATKAIVQIATGALGQEVVIGHAKFLLAANQNDVCSVDIKKDIPVGTRLSYRAYVEAATGAGIAISWTLGQVA